MKKCCLVLASLLASSPALADRLVESYVARLGPEDQSDDFFQSANNRELLQEFLDRGRTTPSAYRMIVNGQPLIRVNIYRRRGGDYVDVDVIGQ